MYREISNGNVVEEMLLGDKLPHFGKMLDKVHAMAFIEGDTFSAYKTRSGAVLNHVKTSETDKWVCILGRYFPVDLICGYDVFHNSIYAIDGTEIKLPFLAQLPVISRDLETFFEDRGINYSFLPEEARARFDEALKRPHTDIQKADFGKVRYLWEKANVDGCHNYWITSKDGRYRPLLKNGLSNPTFFHRVLSDREIDLTVEAVINGDVDLVDYTNFDAYRNEFCVCNGIELLDKLGYPRNTNGFNFLFRCLKDVDEAYFGLAVEVLCRCRPSLVEAKIEAEIKRSFENKDAEGLAGILYLAKQMGYDVKYMEELKKTHKLEVDEELATSS